jgi:hypothetical protein
MKNNTNEKSSKLFENIGLSLFFRNSGFFAYIFTKKCNNVFLIINDAVVGFEALLHLNTKIHKSSFNKEANIYSVTM